MRADDVRSTDPIRHGAYVCLSVPPDARRAAAETDVPALAERLGLKNEFETADGPPQEAIAFLRRIGATPADLADEGLLTTDAVVHVASANAEPVAVFCAQLSELLGPTIRLRILGGVLRPPNYTGNAMHNFAYAHQVVQQPATAMPNGFLIPMTKTAAWWEKGWMERHTYFLPRYDASGRMMTGGHALAAAPGVDFMLRRTYKNPSEPAPDGSYDFINYFECADEDVTKFHEVCAALRDVERNPEWEFVREGPTWHGLRVATWPELFE
jgi:hypothetical protein